MSPEEYDCQACGACCVARTEAWVAVTLEEASRLRVPITTRNNFRAITVEVGKACPALEGRVGLKVSCREYEQRPQVCRGVIPGGPDCLESRKQVLSGR